MLLNRKEYDMEYNKIGLGIIGEKFSNAVVKSAFKLKNGYIIRHVDWDNYSHGSGLDLRVFRKNKLILGIEVKNWRKYDRTYGVETALDEIIDRFKTFTGEHKILIISLKSVLSKNAILLLKRHNIHILEVGKLMGRKLFPRRGKTSTAYFSLKNRLLKLYRELKRQSRGGFGGVNGLDIGCNIQDNHIDNYFESIKTTNHHNNIPNTKQSTIKHDTNVNKTDSYALRLLKSVMKQAQNRKKSNLLGLNPI